MLASDENAQLRTTASPRPATETAGEEPSRKSVFSTRRDSAPSAPSQRIAPYEPSQPSKVASRTTTLAALSMDRGVAPPSKPIRAISTSRPAESTPR